jgi:hypothetical protein
VSALPARASQGTGQRAGSVAAGEWARLQAAAPQAAATIHRYLRQLGTFLAPGSVNAAENALRQFARWMVTEAQITAIADGWNLAPCPEPSPSTARSTNGLPASPEDSLLSGSGQAPDAPCHRQPTGAEP